MKFNKGDYVYYSKGEIGRISDANHDESIDPTCRYRVDYCQGKDLITGARGGNGPIWREGYPKQISEPDDILFVSAMKQKELITGLKKQLKIHEGYFEALKIARQVLINEKPPKTNRRE